MNNYILIVTYLAKKDQELLLRNELIKAMNLIRGEEGCKQFELLVDSNRSNKFVIYEVWEDKSLWKKHLKSDHMQVLNQITSKIVEAFTIEELKFVKEKK